MRLAAGLCPDPLGSYSAPLALQRGGEERREREGLGMRRGDNGERKEGTKGKIE